MYSLEVNFLKDREGILPPPPGGGGPTRPPTPINQKMLMFAGVAVGILLPVAAGGAWLFLDNQIQQLISRGATLDQELGGLQAQEKQRDELLAKFGQIQSETKDLATVFDQMKPWSAMLQDVRDRLPPGVQVTTITQTKAPPPTAPAAPPQGTPAQPAATPPTTDRIELVGVANSFSNVNDLVLTLQKSSFFKDTDTKLVSAALIDNPIQLYVPPSQTGSTASFQPPKLPKVVQFKIETYQSEKPATEMLKELETKGALGLVTRVENLQQQGVLKK